ncbi:hypothetical protein F4V88_29315 [Neorhizobium galegae]|nr:hypothetical protein F4V88_29315 [Neorhizobium galegae]
MISMAYDFAKISMTTLMRPAFDAGIALTRLDERVARSPVGEGWIERDVLQGSDSVRDNPTFGIFHTTRRNSGRPSSVIRLRTWTPILASVF